MPTSLEASYIFPAGTLVVALALLVTAVLTVWSLVEAVVRQRWGWVLAVVFLGPIGGLLWFMVGRREWEPRITTAG